MPVSLPRRLLAMGATILVALRIAAVVSGTAQETTPADSEVNVAGIVIDYGDGRVTYALVPFVEPEISGFDLLSRSGTLLLTIDFGGLGAGICAIDDTGCDQGACRARMCQTGNPDSPFWQYAHLGEDGDWAPSPLGASNQVVADSAINAWSWSDDPPKPGITGIDEIATLLDVDLDAIQRGNSLDAITMTTGSAPPATTVGDRQDVLAATIVGIVATLAGLAIIRSRRSVAT